MKKFTCSVYAYIFFTFFFLFYIEIVYSFGNILEKFEKITLIDLHAKLNIWKQLLEITFEHQLLLPCPGSNPALGNIFFLYGKFWKTGKLAQWPVMELNERKKKLKNYNNNTINCLWFYVVSWTKKINYIL